SFHYTPRVISLFYTLSLHDALPISMKRISKGELFLKRAMDICGGLIGVFFTAIIFLFIAPIIYIQSPGPIFFSQQRVGKNGRKLDRKSTRLNSSHVSISYAVFCLKK